MTEKLLIIVIMMHFWFFKTVWNLIVHDEKSTLVFLFCFATQKLVVLFISATKILLIVLTSSRYIFSYFSHLNTVCIWCRSGACWVCPFHRLHALLWSTGLMCIQGLDIDFKHHYIAHQTLLLCYC